MYYTSKLKPNFKQKSNAHLKNQAFFQPNNEKVVQSFSLCAFAHFVSGSPFSIWSCPPGNTSNLQDDVSLALFITTVPLELKVFERLT
jgi:hypothetical protein